MPATQWDTESTRLLCAAILVDRDLPNRLLRESKAAPRALPAATDVDLATATCCAIVELRRRRVRDGLLAACCALLAVGLIGSIIGDHKLWVLILVSLLVAWVVVLATAMLSTEEMINQFTRRTFNPSQIVAKVDQRRRENLRELYDYPGHNVTVYSGYSPFVGSGGILGSWSFSVDVGTPADQNTPLEQFGVEELRSHVLDGLRDLRWPQLTIEERLFINGLDLVPNSPLLPHGLKRPVQTVDQPTFEALLAGPDEKMRRYTCIRVSGWTETLVFSLWLRFVLHPRSLYVEASSAVLTPVQKSFDLPEQLATMTEMERFRRDLGGANRRTLALLLRSIPSIVQFRRVPHRLNIARERDKRLINSGLPFDYGSGPTVREAIADQNFQHYFQRSDREAIPKPPG